MAGTIRTAAWRRTGWKWSGGYGLVTHDGTGLMTPYGGLVPERRQ